MMDQHICGRCGRNQGADCFYFKAGKIDTAWCKSCHRDKYAERCGGWVDRACDWCGEVMRVTARRARESAVFCSRPCKSDHRNAADKAERLAGKTARPCVHCGATIGPERRIDAQFCSESCNSAAHHVTAKMTKRASARYGGGAPKPPLTNRLTIAERDRYRCQLCGGRVAMWRKHPDPLSPSLDHRVPVAHFGGNYEGNIQLTHLKCNLSKRAGRRPASIQPPLAADFLAA